MDDLDRLAFRLVRTIRQRFPQLREQGFSLTDLEETLLPFRDARRELADTGAEAFEKSMLRLVSGERCYVLTSDELREACRNALGLSSPTMAQVRSWAAECLQLGAAALEIGTERTSGAFDAVRHGSGGAPPLTPDASARATPTTAPALASAPLRMTLSATRPAPHRGCRYCGGRLPDGRPSTFCVHCGLDLSKRQCPACSTQLDVAWRFCVTCGRSADLPEFPMLVPMPVHRAS
jgi:hypothetical protein